MEGAPGSCVRGPLITTWLLTQITEIPIQMQYVFTVKEKVGKTQTTHRTGPDAQNDNFELKSTELQVSPILNH